MNPDKPSQELLQLIETFANKLNNARDLWDEIRIRGSNEGFDERQLAEMVRPFLKQRGLSGNQIWYLFHRDEQKQRSWLQYQSLTTNIKEKNGNKKLEHDTQSGSVEVEFDLVSAIRDVLMPHIQKSSNFAHYMVKARVKDGVLQSMEHEDTKFITYDYMYKMEINTN